MRRSEDKSLATPRRKRAKVIPISEAPQHQAEESASSAVEFVISLRKKIEQSLSGEEKYTLNDYIKVLALEQELLKAEQSSKKEVILRWVDALPSND